MPRLATFPIMLSLLLCLLLLTTLTAAQTTPPIIKVAAGLIQGYYDAQQDVNRFTNIPFAQPPIGPLRFQPPAAANTSYWKSPYAANSTTTIDCIQPTRDNGSGDMSGQEDCLYLSVTAPNPLPAASAGLPVVVYICGGGFQQCWPNDAGSWMRRTQSFIFVNINYRLGIFGFLSLPELAAQQSPISHSGNQGLLDQQAALRWVRDNIAAFGGDPTKVTIQGESAGSISICYHLIMPQSAGLFRSAIMESGGCEVFLPWGSYLMSEQETYVTNALSSACPQPHQTLGCALGLSTADLYSLYRKSPPERGITNDNGYWPVLDGVVLPNTPTAIFQANQANKASVLIGTNAGETVAWLLNSGPTYAYNYSQSTLDTMIGFESGGNATVVSFYNAANYQHRYNGSRPADFGHIYVDATSSEAFHCPARRVAKYMSTAKNTVFHYSWNYLQSSDSSAWTGLAAHAHELALVFYYGPAGNEDAVIAAQVQNYWHRFVAWGDVNHANATFDAPYAAVYGNHTLPQWLPFDYAAGDDHSLLIQNNTATLSHFAAGVAVHADQCDGLWDAVVPLPVVEQRVTQCLHDECSTSEWSRNVCVDNYNSTYHCQCDRPYYVSGSNGTACILVFLPSSSSSTSTGAHVTSAYATSISSSSSSSWSSSSTGDSGESGLTCGVWCYVAIALIILLSLGFAYMIYRMYTNSRKRKEAALLATSPRTTTGSAVPGISSSTTVTTDADGYNVTDERVTVSNGGGAGGRVVRKKKKIRVNTGAGLNDSLLADDRV